MQFPESPRSKQCRKNCTGDGYFRPLGDIKNPYVETYCQDPFDGSPIPGTGIRPELNIEVAVAHDNFCRKKQQEIIDAARAQEEEVAAAPDMTEHKTQRHKRPNTLFATAYLLYEDTRIPFSKVSPADKTARAAFHTMVLEQVGLSLEQQDVHYRTHWFSDAQGDRLQIAFAKDATVDVDEFVHLFRDAAEDTYLEGDAEAYPGYEWCLDNFSYVDRDGYTHKWPLYWEPMQTAKEKIDFTQDYPDLSINIHPTPGTQNDASLLPETRVTNRTMVHFELVDESTGKIYRYRLESREGFDWRLLTRGVQKAFTHFYRHVRKEALDPGNNIGAIASLTYDPVHNCVEAEIASFD